MSDEQEKAEARARRAAERAAKDNEQAKEQMDYAKERIGEIPTPYRSEEHLLSDLLLNAPGIMGISGEVLAGAVASEGWEMTQSVTLEQARTAVQKYLTTPA